MAKYIVLVPMRWKGKRYEPEAILELSASQAEQINRYKPIVKSQDVPQVQRKIVDVEVNTVPAEETKPKATRTRRTTKSNNKEVK